MSTPLSSSSPNQSRLPPPPPLPPPPIAVSIGKTADGLGQALKMLSIERRLNTRSGSIELRRIGTSQPKVHDVLGPEWAEVSDAVSSVLQEVVRETFVFQRGKRAWYGAAAFHQHLLASAAHNQTDPFVEWLEGLPAWDGLGRLDFIFRDALDATHTPLAQAASRFLIAACARTYAPGYQHDYLAVIVGPQGCGKSTFCRELLPSVRGWFVDGLDLSESDKILTEKTLGSVIVEFSELVGVRRTELERLKTFISQRESRVRLAYQRFAGSFLRQWVPIGTANDTGTGVLPQDRSGHRRFAIVETGPDANPVDVHNYLTANREQLWAEALARYRAGEATHLPASMETAATEAARPYTASDDGLDNAAADIHDRYAGTSDGHALADLIVEADLAVDSKAVQREHRLQRDFGAAMRSLGWTKRVVRQGTTQRKEWFPPSE